MFRNDLLLREDERFARAGRTALSELETSVRAYLGKQRSDDPRWLRSAVLGAWSTVHGFASLALDGKLTRPDDSLAIFVDRELPRVLRSLWPD